MNKLLLGVLFGILGQVASFMQLQGSVKYDWFHKYPLLLLLSAIPTTYFYVKSVENLVIWGDGALWPSRLIGFGIGIIVFETLSMILFKEPLTLKTITCLILACAILGVQIFWK